MIPQFRAWNVKDQTMIEIKDLSWFKENQIHQVDDNPNLIFMLATGLEDRKGVDVFDGDIIFATARDNNRKLLYKVHYDATYGGWVALIMNPQDVVNNHHNQPLGEVRFDMEVVSHIYKQEPIALHHLYR